MHKKLEVELMSLAHQILQLKNKDDVSVLKEKAKEVYEKLSVLSFMDNYFQTTPNAPENKLELLAKMAQKKVVETAKNVLDEIKKPEVVVEEPKILVKEVVSITETIVKEDKIEEVEIKSNANLMEEASKIAQKINEVENKSSIKSFANTEEFKDTISADVTANLFEKVKPKVTIDPVIPEPVKVQQEPVKVEEPIIKQVLKADASSDAKTSLNDRLLGNKIQIGLNDRIAFVKHLFNFSQEDFNRVLSQLNTFSSEKETRDFIAEQVKPDYDWSTKEEYEHRLYSLIERRFL